MLHNRLRAAAGSAWTPANLFANGEYGLWHEFADASGLWQDTAGTSAVTATGQQIARSDDKSGNGLHFTQPTSSSRPLYQETSGIGRARHDGSDDFMLTSALISSIALNGSLFVAMKPNASGVIGGAISEMQTGGDTDDVLRRIVVYCDTRTSITRLGNYAPESIDYYVDLDSGLATAEVSLLATNDSGIYKGYVNGAQQASTQSVPASSFTKDTVIEMGRQAVGGLYSDFDIIMCIGLNRALTQSEIEKLSSYADNLMGV